MPRAFVTEHQQRRIGRRELKVIVPVGAAEERFDLACFRVDGDELQRPSFRETVLHHLAFAGIVIAAPRRWWHRWLSRLKLSGQLLIDDSCEQCLVCVN